MAVDKSFFNYLKRVQYAIYLVVALALAIGFGKPSDPFLFPPAAQLSEFATPLLAFFLVCTAFVLPSQLNSPVAAQRVMRCFFGILIVLAIGYVVLVRNFVVEKPISAIRQTVYVIRGWDRSEAAKQGYPDTTDQQLLDNGIDEEALNELYTHRSLIIYAMLLCYLGLPVTFAIAVGSMCRKDQLESVGVLPEDFDTKGEIQTDAKI